MRTIIAALAFPTLLLAAGCTLPADEPEPTDTAEEAVRGDGTGESGAGDRASDQETEETQERTYAVGEQITVELTMRSNEEGGRHTPFFSGYRPTVEFDHLEQSVACSVQLPADLERFEPGQTHLVSLECAGEIVGHPDDAGFVLVESGKENGEGTVVFTEA